MRTAGTGMSAAAVFVAGTAAGGDAGVSAGTGSAEGRLSAISFGGGAAAFGGAAAGGAVAGADGAGAGSFANGGSRRMVSREAIPPVFDAAEPDAGGCSRRGLSARLLALLAVDSPARGFSSTRGAGVRIAVVSFDATVGDGAVLAARESIAGGAAGGGGVSTGTLAEAAGVDAVAPLVPSALTFASAGAIVELPSGDALADSEDSSDRAGPVR